MVQEGFNCHLVIRCCNVLAGRWIIIADLESRLAKSKADVSSKSIKHFPKLNISQHKRCYLARWHHKHFPT